MTDDPLEPIDLGASAKALLQQARDSSAGRATQPLISGSGNRLTQSLVALRGGESLDEHENPGMATLQVVRGRARLLAGEQKVELAAGGWAPVPPRRHAVESVEDAVILLTVSGDAAVSG